MQPRAVISGTLWVDPRYRRQGVAQRLLREAETHARLRGFGELLLPVDPRNKRAICLYQKMGFSKVPATAFARAQVTMRRKLFSPDMHTVHSMLNRHTVVSLH